MYILIDPLVYLFGTILLLPVRIALYIIRIVLPPVFMVLGYIVGWLADKASKLAAYLLKKLYQLSIYCGKRLYERSIYYGKKLYVYFISNNDERPYDG